MIVDGTKHPTKHATNAIEACKTTSDSEKDFGIDDSSCNSGGYGFEHVNVVVPEFLSSNFERE